MKHMISSWARGTKLTLLGLGLFAMSLAGLFPAAVGAAPTYTITDLGTLGDGPSGAQAINDVGQVVGDSLISSNYPFFDNWSHAFLWTPGSPNGTTGAMVDLGRSAPPWTSTMWARSWASTPPAATPSS